MYTYGITQNTDNHHWYYCIRHGGKTIMQWRGKFKTRKYAVLVAETTCQYANDKEKENENRDRTIPEL